MLTHLDIRNVVLIDHLALDFQAGLSVLTGETGAGKSILLDALGLVRGDRAGGGLVRAGADQAAVTAEFDVPPTHPVLAMLEAQGVPMAMPLILRRTLAMDGKSRAFINDQMVSVGLMKSVATQLVDIHGQFETGYLFDPAHHRRMLDRFGGHTPLTQDVAQAWQARVTARAELTKLEEDAARAARDVDYMRASRDDLQKLAAIPGEEDKLLERKQLLSARAQIIDGLSQVRNDLQGDDGAETAVLRALRVITRLQGKLPGATGQAWESGLDTALAALRDVVGGIDQMLFDADSSGDNLEQIDDRLHDLRAASRRYGCTVDELPARQAEFEAKLALISTGADQIAQVQAAVQRADNDYLKAAKRLSSARQQAAEKLDAAIMRELAPLKLERARFVTDVSALPDDRCGADGMDAVRFTAAMNPGTAPAPIDRAASGGELSRLMLALKVVLRGDDQGCLIFDEVDAGLGGAVAAAMAQRLARLADDTQVLVVTHAPQVAARAEHHFIVAKKTRAGVTTTSVHALADADERREEIARMLSGTKITDEARAAAKKLIETQAA